MVKGGWLDALLHRSKSPNSTAIDTRSCQHIPKMVLFCHKYYEIQQMRRFLRTLSRSFFNTVENGQSPGLFWWWTTLHVPRQNSHLRRLLQSWKRSPNALVPLQSPTTHNRMWKCSHESALSWLLYVRSLWDRLSNFCANQNKSHFRSKSNVGQVTTSHLWVPAAQRADSLVMTDEFLLYYRYFPWNPVLQTREFWALPNVATEETRSQQTNHVTCR